MIVNQRPAEAMICKKCAHGAIDTCLYIFVKNMVIYGCKSYFLKLVKNIKTTYEPEFEENISIYAV
jgi:hypothetical protein